MFLVGGFVLHGVGLAMALSAGARLNLATLLWTQVAITAIQLMTHYSNDYFDLEADRANTTPTQWSGGSRVLPEGLLPPVVALVTAVALMLVALAAALVVALALQPAPLTLPLLVLALFLGWSYSSPPLRLHTRRLGEVTAAVLVAGITPLVGYYTQTGRLAWLPLLAAVPLICFQLAMLLAVHLPDVEGDLLVGKRTLVVVLGRAGAARLYMGLLALAYALLPLLALAGLPWPVALATMMGLPIAAGQVWRMGRGAWADPIAWNSLAFGSIVLLMGTAVLQVIGFLAVR